MKPVFVLIFSLAILPFFSIAKDDKNKEQKLIEKEEEHFQKLIRKNPTDATVYWNHAKNLLQYKSQIVPAVDYFTKAIQLDSTNGLIYKDLGKYWFSNRRDYDKASEMFTKAIQFKVNDEEMKPFLEIIDKVNKMRAEEARLHDVGNAETIAMNPNNKSITNFDSLKKLVTDPSSFIAYSKLLERFLKDDPSFTVPEMYLLMIGYSFQKSYNPYSYSDINQLKGIANLDTALTEAMALTQFYPINPTLNREIMYYYRKKNNEQMARHFQHRVRLYFDAMLYSGDGTCDKPYVTLWAKEEDNFIAYLGNDSKDEHVMGSCGGQMSEQLKMLNPKTGKKEEINFNIQLIYMQSMR